MTEKESLFWNRVLELAEDKFTQAVFDFFISDAKLIRVSNQVATIFLEEKKELYWQSNLTDIILTAGFEIFNQEILAEYVFEEVENNHTDISEDFNSPTKSLVSSNVLDKPTIETDLNPKYRFDNFISGKGTQWALAAALAVAGSPGTVYNPLFIWGGPGLGKTHLLNAIGNSVIEENPRARVRYITTENFINEFVTHIRLGTTDELKEKFRHLDVLLIDDIQFLAKKQGTQEEFFNTFTALHDNNKQIVLTSDRAPEQLNDLEERLVSRFSWGLTQDITPPDYETRIAILQDKIQDYPYQFLSETIEYLAGQFVSNVRELEGALKNISLVANVKKVDTITVDLAAEAIRAKKQEPVTISVIPIDTIQTEVGKFYGVSVKEIKSTKRNQNIVLARQVAIFLAREMTDNSLPKIGKEFGGRDHSTILHAYNKIKNMLKTDDGLRIEIETLRQKVR